MYAHALQDYSATNHCSAHSKRTVICSGYRHSDNNSGTLLLWGRRVLQRPRLSCWCHPWGAVPCPLQVQVQCTLSALLQLRAWVLPGLRGGSGGHRIRLQVWWLQPSNLRQTVRRKPWWLWRRRIQWIVQALWRRVHTASRRSRLLLRASSYTANHHLICLFYLGVAASPTASPTATPNATPTAL